MIDKEQAVELAKKRSEEKGWAFSEPIDIAERRGWNGEVFRYDLETTPANWVPNLVLLSTPKPAKSCRKVISLVKS